MATTYICRRCGDTRLPPPHDWAGEGDRFRGATEPHPGGLGVCGDLHEWVRVVPVDDVVSLLRAEATVLDRARQDARFHGDSEAAHRYWHAARVLRHVARRLAEGPSVIEQ